MNEEEMEHHFYAIGKWFLSLNRNNNTALTVMSNVLGNEFESIRFQSLVRLGADIENANLASIPRATLVGALIYQKEKRML